MRLKTTATRLLQSSSRWNLKTPISLTWKYNGKPEPILIICYVIYTSICYDIYLIWIILWESRDLIWWQPFILAYIVCCTFSVLGQTYLAWHSHWVLQHKYRIVNNSLYITTGNRSTTSQNVSPYARKWCFAPLGIIAARIIQLDKYQSRLCHDIRPFITTKVTSTEFTFRYNVICTHHINSLEGMKN